MAFSSRVIKMLHAERARLGTSANAPVSEKSPPTIRMAIVADFLLGLEFLKASAPLHMVEDLARYYESVRWLLRVTGLDTMIASKEFYTIFEALKKDYLDAMERNRKND